MGRYAGAARRAAEMTNKQLKQHIATLNSMDDTKVQQLFPRKADKQKFVDLMKQVEKKYHSCQQDKLSNRKYSNLSADCS